MIETTSEYLRKFEYAAKIQIISEPAGQSTVLEKLQDFFRSSTGHTINCSQLSIKASPDAGLYLIEFAVTAHTWKEASESSQKLVDNAYHSAGFIFDEAETLPHSEDETYLYKSGSCLTSNSS